MDLVKVKAKYFLISIIPSLVYVLVISNIAETSVLSSTPYGELGPVFAFLGILWSVLVLYAPAKISGSVFVQTLLPHLISLLLLAFAYLLIGSNPANIILAMPLALLILYHQRVIRGQVIAFRYRLVAVIAIMALGLPYLYFNPFEGAISGVDGDAILLRASLGSFFSMVYGAAHFMLATRELEQLEKQKVEQNKKLDFQSDLLSVISHNIRTPLTNVYTRIEIEKLKKSEGTRELVDQVAGDVQKLVNIVETTLATSRLFNNVDPPVNYLSLTAQLKKLYGPKVAVTTSRTANQILLHSPGVVLFALQNFIENGIRHSAKPIEVNLRCHGPIAYIQIEDHGEGMAEDVLANYGKPTVSVGNGKGIGVHLSVRIIESVGYQLAVETLPGVGTRIHLIQSRERIDWEPLLYPHYYHKVIRNVELSPRRERLKRLE